MSKGLVFVCLLLGLTNGRSVVAQERSPQSASTLEVLLQEVRLLREAIETQGALQSHVGLLMGRLALQDQRVARAAELLKELEDKAAQAALQRERYHDAVRDLQRQIETADDEKGRATLTERLNRLRRERFSTERDNSRVEQRVRSARQALETEEGRYSEIEAFVDHLDRKLYLDTK